MAHAAMMLFLGNLSQAGRLRIIQGSVREMYILHINVQRWRLLSENLEDILSIIS